ncbi:MAG: formate acetyltransferase, partial [Proteobacteria bacterium]|nr:formate acetyltransferase [Pseudomonadota bacterium]
STGNLCFESASVALRPRNDSPLWPAMILCLEGLTTYARNLARQAAKEAKAEKKPRRRAELSRLAEICTRVPENPAQTFDEAVNVIWLGFMAQHMENTNTGQSIGRLDQWLQPYFEAEMEQLASPAEREAFVRRAIDLVGCLYLRCTDHMPVIPDIGNYLFGGSSSDQAITLGGVTTEGEDAVNDMTYVCLKVTELLGLRDPNVNARYHPGKNSDTYLKRLCEVNLITGATPSMHNDVAVFKALEPFGYDEADVWDWSATGCVEPSLSCKHMAHTGSILLNIVAPLEMALHQGRHPLLNQQVGPQTKAITEFEDFEAFFQAYATQLGFLAEQAVSFNNMLGVAHEQIRPSPYLSSLMEGCIASGRDATAGGAQYNSSGVACIGLADVTDSLIVIKKLVFESHKISFEQLFAALENDFDGDAPLLALVQNKVPLFGSGDKDALEMANRVACLARDILGKHKNHRQGPYKAGFWSMSNHVAFGSLAGALPSGRRAGKAFTPGLTPQPIASKNLLDNLRDVAHLDPTSAPNNMAFNVKVVPSADESHQRQIDNMHATVKTFFKLGGMQIQLNVISSQTLRDAMVNPEAHRDLMVRISGYNAYFVTLNR